MFGGDGGGDLVDEVFVPDCVRGKGALVGVGVAVHLAFGAKGLVAGQTLLAVTTAVVLITPADNITFSDVLD